MYSEENLNSALKVIEKDIRFYGLDKNSENFQENHKHYELLESYKKIHQKRSRI